MIFEKETFCLIPAKYIVFPVGSVRFYFTAFRRAQATSSQVKMENGVAHPQIEARWMGGKHVSCCYLKIFHVQKKCFYLFGQFLSNLHLFGGVFSTFLPLSLVLKKPSRPRIFPLQKLSALLMFLFLPSCWMRVCKLNQPEYQFDLHYVLFNLFARLHYPFWS